MVQVWDFPGDNPDVMVRNNVNGTDGSLARRLAGNTCWCPFYTNPAVSRGSCPGGSPLFPPYGAFITCCGGTVSTSIPYSIVYNRRRFLEENELGDWNPDSSSGSDRTLQGIDDVAEVFVLVGDNTLDNVFNDTIRFGDGTFLSNEIRVTLATTNEYRIFPCSEGCPSFSFDGECPAGGEELQLYFEQSIPYTQTERLSGSNVIVGCSEERIVTIINVVAVEPSTPPPTHMPSGTASGDCSTCSADCIYVQGLVLVDADQNADLINPNGDWLVVLEQGTNYSLSQLQNQYSTPNFAVLCITWPFPFEKTPFEVGSVGLRDNNYRTHEGTAGYNNGLDYNAEASPPYTLAEDNSGDYNPTPFAQYLGPWSITCQAFCGSDLDGDASSPYTVQFNMLA